MGAREAYDRHHKLMGKRDTYAKLPQYMAAAKRSESGELGFVRVRYTRRTLTENVDGRHPNHGRAYPVVLNPETGEVYQGGGRLSLTTMPTQVRNALICHPTGHCSQLSQLFVTYKLRNP